MKDAAFLDELWRVADSIIAHFNAGEAIKILTDKLAMHGDGVLFHLPVGRKTAWGTDLMFWNHGRFYSLTINHAEWFEKYKRELEYHADYWFTERFFKRKIWGGWGHRGDRKPSRRDAELLLLDNQRGKGRNPAIGPRWQWQSAHRNDIHSR